MRCVILLIMKNMPYFRLVLLNDKVPAHNKSEFFTFFILYDFRVVHEKSGRSLEIYSDQPGIQFYTSNWIPDPENKVNY